MDAKAKQLTRIPSKSWSSGERPNKWAGEQSNQYDSEDSETNETDVNCNEKCDVVVKRGHIESPNSSGSSMTTEYTSSTYSLGRERSMVSEDDGSCSSSAMKAEEEVVEERGEETDTNANHQQKPPDTLRCLCTHAQCLMNKRAELQVTVNDKKPHGTHHRYHRDMV